MEAKREQALVGLFVLVAGGLLIVTLVLLSGALTTGDTTFHTFFKNAGGLQPGSEVRYAGGPPIGRVRRVQVDPTNSTRMQVDFAVHPNIPVKTDSSVIITSNSPLGENFLDILAGTIPAQRAPAGYTLQSKEPVSFSDIADKINALAPTAQELIVNLNDRVVELKVTLNRVNDLLNDRNRENVAESLANVRGMLQEDRPLVHSSLEHVNTASAKLGPLIDDFKKTSEQANVTLDRIDSMIKENRPDVRSAVKNLRASLIKANSILSQLDNTVANNSENLDEIIDNLRRITENMTAFTETIREKPYLLIRSSEPKNHEPGKEPPK
ncbi:MAG TPA: MlaD family protein [Candidatus Acidoferrales bacterium]|jgi:phospholipid/cholesterol/gamma-HCH transport system substrate-binding protein